MGIEDRSLPLTRRQANVRPPRNSGHFRTESRRNLLANIARPGNRHLLGQVISKVLRGQALLRIDFSEGVAAFPNGGSIIRTSKRTLIMSLRWSTRRFRPIRPAIEQSEWVPV